MLKAETAVKKFSTKLQAAVHENNDNWEEWDSDQTLIATKLAMRAFPDTVRNLSPIQCLTGRVPKVHGHINLNDTTELIDDTTSNSGL